MNTALVLVDIQNDYFPGGRNPLLEPEAAAARAAGALALFRERGWPLFHIQHVNTNLAATFFLDGTDGMKIHSSVAPLPGEPVVVKHRPDSFYQTDLHDRLDSVGACRLVVCGMMSHMCIDTTVRSAKGRDYEIVLLHDACTTRDLEWEGAVIPAAIVHGAYMAALRGTFAEVMSSGDLPGILDR